MDVRSVGDDAGVLGYAVVGYAVLVDAVEESVGAGSIVCPVDCGELIGSGEPAVGPDGLLPQAVNTAPRLAAARLTPTPRANPLSEALGRSADDACEPSARTFGCKRASAGNRLEASRIAVAEGASAGPVLLLCTGCWARPVTIGVIPRGICISLPQSVRTVCNVPARGWVDAPNANHSLPKRIVRSLVWGRQRHRRLQGAAPDRPRPRSCEGSGAVPADRPPHRK